MRSQSHRCLGRYLVRHYLDGVTKLQAKAFLIGCLEPDRNPATYLKGSLRCQWLRGHNYHNAQRFMKRLSLRLERKERLNLFDYYSLGKLIHYTADAFTYAHNTDFPSALSVHKHYEAELQNHFLAFLSLDPQVDILPSRGIMDAICSFHQDYEQRDYTIQNDCHFALTACCCVLTILFTTPMM